MLKQVNITEDGTVFRKGVEEVHAPTKTDSKSIKRLEIQDSVFDIEDSLADTTKWLSLLTTVVERMYSVMPAADKANLTAADKAMIDYAMTKFKATTTRADTQYAIEGNVMIDKILNRQSQINKII